MQNCVKCAAQFKKQQNLYIRLIKVAYLKKILEDRNFDTKRKKHIRTQNFKNFDVNVQKKVYQYDKKPGVEIEQVTN